MTIIVIILFLPFFAAMCMAAVIRRDRLARAASKSRVVDQRALRNRLERLQGEERELERTLAIVEAALAVALNETLQAEREERRRRREEEAVEENQFNLAVRRMQSLELLDGH